MKRLPSALRWLRFQLLRQRLKRIEKHQQRAARQLEAGHDERARATFEHILKHAPNDLSAMIGLASIDSRAGRYPQALARWDALLRHHPDAYWAVTGRAQTLLAANRLEDAEQAFSAALSRWPTRIECMTGSAEVAQAAGRLDQALQRWQAIRQQFPDNHWAPIKYAGTLLELDRPAEAETLFAQLIADGNQDLSTLTGHADALAAQHKYRQAIDRWRAIDRRFPHTEHVLLRMGNCYAALHDDAAAERLYLQVQRRWPSHLLAFHLHSLLLEKTRRAADAAADHARR